MLANISMVSFDICLKRAVMHRTIPWSEGPCRDENPTRLWEVFDFKPFPLSSTFHDRSTEITGNFHKFSITDKTKEKTRKAIAPAEEEVEHLREPAPELSPEFEVDRKLWTVFQAMFHIPGENEQPGTLRWNAVVSALVHLGFAAQHMHGSQWQFTPSPALNLTRGISFYEPHPGDEVPVELARKYGRRLNRAYGWEGPMFKMA
jgi:hypothetical protein